MPKPAPKKPDTANPPVAPRRRGGLVRAFNKDTKRPQNVPAHYIDNPAIFGGVFTTLPAEAPKAEPADSDAGTPAN